MDTVEIANRQGTGWLTPRVLKAAENLHQYALFLIAMRACPSSAACWFLLESEYIA
ncbi:hypothetical protein [Pantoea sp. 18069]|uniref:hypothetical protein n=1 Tax=Pantoea sp. 18069 TaxID=2681415 RepID=UPI00190F499C|nr:hypothetical protein [Pantoea sp. 18069]